MDSKVLAERLLFTVILVLLSPGNESEEGNNRENANELLIMQFHVGEWGGDQLTETMSSFSG